MKPVLVLQNLSGDGPAHLATWLRQQGLAFEVRNAEAGDSFVADLAAFSALAVLGGEMGANDPLPSLRQAEALIRDAMQRGLPVIGHCLGGQLMARALGAQIGASPAPEIGWQPLTVFDNAVALDWFGTAGPRTVFQWHFDAFQLPAGATPLAGSAACPHQAFALGPHLALQFHVEIDAEKLGRWALDEGDRYRSALRDHSSVQAPAAMLAGVQAHLAAHQALADRLYHRWLRGLISR